MQLRPPSPTRPPAPLTEDALLALADAIAGWTIGRLARSLGRETAPDQRRAKGLVGALVEAALGADAGSRPGPDFAALGIELKTLPVDRRGRPRETTFVCSLHPDELVRTSWEASRLRAKLARVLWVPVLSVPEVPLAERPLGAPLLWSPSPEDEARLRADHALFQGLVGAGRIDDVTAHLGEVVQVRPKAAHGRARRLSADEEGGPILSLPRGFYLRTAFTGALLARAFATGLGAG